MIDSKRIRQIRERAQEVTPDHHGFAIARYREDITDLLAVVDLVQALPEDWCIVGHFSPGYCKFCRRQMTDEGIRMLPDVQHAPDCPVPAIEAVRLAEDENASTSDIFTEPG